LRRGGASWFDENLRNVIGDGKETNFWIEPWINEDDLRHPFSRVYDMIVEGVGEEGCFNRRRRWFGAWS
jgi:hypothetical protein